MSRLFLSLLSALLLACAVIVGGYWHDAYVARPATDAQAVAFVVQSGETLKAVADRLKAQGLVSSPWMFELFAKLSDQAARVQAGQFRLKPGMSFSDLMNALANATAQDVEVTIPEGYSAAQIGETVRAAIPSISEKDWAEAVGPHSPALEDADLARALPPELSKRGLEGFLFPDTYRFHPNAAAKDVVHTLLFTFLQKTLAAGIKVGGDGTVAHGLNFSEFVTLSSIVEKEVQKPEDMKLVADIFLKRLKDGIPLQSDATVNYVTGGKYAAISSQDQAIDSPYNTYKHPGLPPAPISNPGLNALTAVLTPTANDWYYFLTAPDGTVKYARTYDQHIANKQKYLK